MVNIFNILLIILCYFMINLVYVSALPDVMAYFDTSSQTIKASMTIFQAGAVISCILGGFFADFIGKKNFLVAGIIIALIGSTVCFLAPNIEVLILGRFLQGAGGATGFMMGFALAVDLFEPKQTLKIIALNAITVAVTCTFISYIGGLITDIYSWRGVFLFMCPFLLVALVLSLMHLPPKSNTKKPYVAFSKNLKEFVTVGKSLRYLSYAILNAFFLGGTAFSLSFLPLYYSLHLGLSADSIGFVIGISIWLAFGVASILSNRFYNRFGIDNSIYLGLILTGIGSVGVLCSSIFFQSSLTITVIGVGIYFFGFGVFYSGSISQCMRVFPELTTKASSLRTIMLSVFSLIGAYAVQNIGVNNLFGLGLAYALTVILSIAIFMMRGNNVKSNT